MVGNGHSDLTEAKKEGDGRMRTREKETLECPPTYHPPYYMGRDYLVIGNEGHGRYMKNFDFVSWTLVGRRLSGACANKRLLVGVLTSEFGCGAEYTLLHHIPGGFP